MHMIRVAWGMYACDMLLATSKELLNEVS